MSLSLSEGTGFIYVCSLYFFLSLSACVRACRYLEKYQGWGGVGGGGTGDGEKLKIE